MQGRKKETIGIWGQWIGMSAVLVGIGIEFSYGAHIGFICITVGSLVWAIATKIRGK